jgi:hypothetical protein
MVPWAGTELIRSATSESSTSVTCMKIAHLENKQLIEH